MNYTKIEWCDRTWNPVTGCYHGCEYCYAHRIANRFSAKKKDKTFCGGHPYIKAGDYNLHELDEPATMFDEFIKPELRKEPYPFGFEPTFHRYRLNEPESWKKPSTVFVCSMADLFGDWIPDEWIKDVFEACAKAPMHRYIFLTKNPVRYCDLYRKNILPKGDNFWFGATFDHSNWSGEEISGRPATFSLKGEIIHDAGDYYFPVHPENNRLVCFEPILYDIGKNIGSIGANWIIIGAETGNRREKIVPEKEWIDNICEAADREHIPVFMKDSLIPIVGEKEMRRGFPWDKKAT